MGAAPGAVAFNPSFRVRPASRRGGQPHPVEGFTRRGTARQQQCPEVPEAITRARGAGLRVVLLGDSFTSLVEAVALGRRIEANLHRALSYALAIHLPIACLSALPLRLPSQPLLLLPVQVALLHLMIDPACTVVVEAIPAQGAPMRRPPGLCCKGACSPWWPCCCCSPCCCWRVAVLLVLRRQR